jgi:hypothetical protein
MWDPGRTHHECRRHEHLCPSPGSNLPRLGEAALALQGRTIGCNLGCLAAGFSRGPTARGGHGFRFPRPEAIIAGVNDVTSCGPTHFSSGVGQRTGVRCTSERVVCFDATWVRIRDSRFRSTET